MDTLYGESHKLIVDNEWTYLLQYIWKNIIVMYDKKIYWSTDVSVRLSIFNSRWCMVTSEAITICRQTGFDTKTVADSAEIPTLLRAQQFLSHLATFWHYSYFVSKCFTQQFWTNVISTLFSLILFEGPLWLGFGNSFCSRNFAAYHDNFERPWYKLSIMLEFSLGNIYKKLLLPKTNKIHQRTFD